LIPALVAGAVAVTAIVGLVAWSKRRAAKVADRIASLERLLATERADREKAERSVDHLQDRLAVSAAELASQIERHTEAMDHVETSLARARELLRGCSDPAVLGERLRAVQALLDAARADAEAGVHHRAPAGDGDGAAGSGG
jgi:chromosome segregation ATPase